MTLLRRNEWSYRNCSNWFGTEPQTIYPIVQKSQSSFNFYCFSVNWHWWPGMFFSDSLRKLSGCNETLLAGNLVYACIIMPCSPIEKRTKHTLVQRCAVAFSSQSVYKVNISLNYSFFYFRMNYEKCIYRSTPLLSQRLPMPGFVPKVEIYAKGFILCNTCKFNKPNFGITC